MLVIENKQQRGIRQTDRGGELQAAARGRLERYDLAGSDSGEG